MKNRSLFTCFSVFALAFILACAFACGALAAQNEDPVAAAPEAPFSDATPYTADENGDIVLCVAAEPMQILLPDRATESETAAAQLLSDYTAEITGTPARVSSGDTDRYLREYYAGANTGVFVVLRQLSSPETPFGSFRLRAGKDADGKAIENKTFYIEAWDARGLFNGVYAFLRDRCGVNLYSADVKTVPQAEKITVPDGYYKNYVPRLEYADTDWISPHDLDFAVANGLNGTYSPIDAVHGGKVNYITFCHSLTTSIVPEGELYESNPEYYALMEDGKTREATQLCLSNPAVVSRAIEDVLRLIGENYDPDACLNIISVTQDDNQEYCRCENCTAIAERYGAQSGLMLWFVNQIAEAVEKSEHPDVLVDTFAYQYTRSAPTGISPRGNVCVRLCSIECCFAHALNDPACERNTDFMRDLQDWAAISNRLYIWDYTTNYSQTLGIFPDFGVLKSNIETFVKNSVVGIYEEGAYYVSTCDTEFADLRAYLLARYMYDPLCEYEDTDEADLVNGFMQAYYGGGADDLAAFYDFIREHAGDNEGHLSIGQKMADTLHGVTNKNIKELDKLWDQAEEKAEGDALARVKRSRVSWEYYKACAKVGEYRRGLLPWRWINANKALIADLEAMGVTRYNEGRAMSELTPSPYFSPDLWSETDNFTGYLITVIGALLVVILAVITAFVGFKRGKKRLLLLIPYVGVLAALAAYTSVLFIRWDHIPFYFLMILAFHLLVGLSFFTGAWAVKGFSFPSKKFALCAYAIGAVGGGALFEILIYVTNNMIYKCLQPALACAYTYLLPELIVFVSLAVTLVRCLWSGRRKAAAAENGEPAENAEPEE